MRIAVPRGLALPGRGSSVAVAVWDKTRAGRHLAPRPGARLLDVVSAARPRGRSAVGDVPFHIVLAGRLTLSDVGRALRDWLQ